MTQQTERFSATSGRVMGSIAIGLALLVAVLSATDRDGPDGALIALMVFLAALAWAALVRPRVDLEPEHLVLHTLLSTVTLPLRSIDSVDVRQVLVVGADARRFSSPAVGRSRRQLQQASRGPSAGRTRGARGMMAGVGAAPPAQDTASTSYAVFVQERLRARVADAKSRAGASVDSDDPGAQITRRPAVPEIAVLVVSALAFVVLVAL